MKTQSISELIHRRFTNLNVCKGSIFLKKWALKTVAPPPSSQGNISSSPISPKFTGSQGRRPIDSDSLAWLFMHLFIQKFYSVVAKLMADMNGELGACFDFQEVG